MLQVMIVALEREQTGQHIAKRNHHFLKINIRCTLVAKRFIMAPQICEFLHYERAPPLSRITTTAVLSTTN